MAVSLKNPGLDVVMALETGGRGLPWIDDIGITPPSDLKMQAAGSVAALTDPVQPFIIHDRKLMSTVHGALEVLDYLRMTHFRVRRGQRIRVRFKNLIPQESNVHWHGLHVAPKDDGHHRLAVFPGGEYVYDFQVDNRDGTYWYHPHPHGLTGNQVYGGMAGLFLISDREEQALGLSSGEDDLALVLQDRPLVHQLPQA